MGFECKFVCQKIRYLIKIFLTDGENFPKFAKKNVHDAKTRLL